MIKIREKLLSVDEVGKIIKLDRFKTINFLGMEKFERYEFGKVIFVNEDDLLNCLVGRYKLDRRILEQQIVEIRKGRGKK
ncbi:MAG: hypothetical protein PHW52_01020 [Candidatus Pacebacteria bacterium]|nr:hypothetical protein [Candidatus Paceibacterota bacterium]